MHRITALVFTVIACISTHAQIYINGRKAVYDSQHNFMLATIPESALGNDYEATIRIDSEWRMVIINGKKITDSYTFSRVETNKQYVLSFADTLGNVKTCHLFFTFLPLLQLSGNFGYNYQQGTFFFVHPDSSQTEIFPVNIKWRGGTTNGWDKHKRNYKIELAEDHRFFNLRSDNHWLLDAGQADVFRLRNHIATEIWNDFATRPYYSNKKPNALSGTRGEIVEVFLNNEYMGIYRFMENLDRKQMKLKKVDTETGEIHGCLWKAKGYGASMMYQLPEEPYDNHQPKWNVFEVKYPDFNDNDTTDYSTLYNAIDFVVNAHDTAFIAHVAEYFDLPVLADYAVFFSVLSAADNNGKNTMWAVYDKAVDKKLTLAVWDLDATVGQKWIALYSDENYLPSTLLDAAVFVYRRLHDNNNLTGFTDSVTNRYNKLRQGIFSTDSLIARYRHCYQLLKRSGAATREEARWSGDSDVNGMTIDFDDEIEYICNWITEHMQWMDMATFPVEDWFEHRKAGLNKQPQWLSDTSSEAVYTLSGQRINGRPRSGIYIRKGKKYIVH